MSKSSGLVYLVNDMTSTVRLSLLVLTKYIKKTYTLIVAFFIFFYVYLTLTYIIITYRSISIASYLIMFIYIIYMNRTSQSGLSSMSFS